MGEAEGQRHGKGGEEENSTLLYINAAPGITM